MLDYNLKRASPIVTYKQFDVIFELERPGGG